MFGWDGGEGGGGGRKMNGKRKTKFIDKEIALGRKKNVIMIPMDTITVFVVLLPMMIMRRLQA